MNQHEPTTPPATEPIDPADVGPTVNASTPTKPRIGLYLCRVRPFGWCVTPYGASWPLRRFVSRGEAMRWVRKQRWKHEVLCIETEERDEQYVEIGRFTVAAHKGRGA